MGFEFMQDNRIHVKHVDGRYEQIPVFSLKAGLGKTWEKSRAPIFFWGKSILNMAILRAGVGTQRMILSTFVCGSNMDLCKETKK